MDRKSGQLREPMKSDFLYLKEEYCKESLEVSLKMEYGAVDTITNSIKNTHFIMKKMW